VDRTIACSIDRARLELGFEPKVAIEEGMRRSVRWCLDAGHRL
jgi:nucleoside-diphosphate-sugar epimerase